MPEKGFRITIEGSAAELPELLGAIGGLVLNHDVTLRVDQLYSAPPGDAEKQFMYNPAKVVEIQDVETGQEVAVIPRLHIDRAYKNGNSTSSDTTRFTRAIFKAAKREGAGEMPYGLKPYFLFNAAGAPLGIRVAKAPELIDMLGGALRVPMVGPDSIAAFREYCQDLIVHLPADKEVD